MPPKLFHNLPSSLLQVPRPIVITQALPQLQQLIFLHLRQIRHRRQRFHKAPIIAQHSGHSSLLEHDLGHPYMVWGGIAAPGQGALVVTEPFQQGEYQMGQSGNAFIHREKPPISTELIIAGKALVCNVFDRHGEMW